MSKQIFRAGLLAGVATFVLAGNGYAQTPAEDTGALEQVVVTATRQSANINRVALSVAAITEKGLDQARVISVNDLARIVPSVVFRQTGYGQATTIAIRGIYSPAGAPTTGVYLDETPISRRVVGGGGPGSANNAPYPNMFDVDRVEVLRGPQGTLFGASAQGGAVRFIMRDPSLTTYTGRARVGASATENGSPSYEAGVAFGGPIIPDKLGFRVVFNGSKTGGYIDHVSPLTGNTFAKNTDWSDRKAGRIAVTWQATDKLKLTPSWYYGEDYRADTSSFIENLAGFTLNSGYFINRGTGATGVAYSQPSTYFAGGQYGPFNMFGPYKTPIGYDNEANLRHSPEKSFFSVKSLRSEYDFGPVVATSVTSYLIDRIKNQTWGENSGTYNYAVPFGTLNNAVRGCFSQNAVTCVPVVGGLTNGQPALNPFYPGFAQLAFPYYFDNGRHQFTQEIRFASKPDARPFQWVAGVYYMNNKTNVETTTGHNEPSLSIAYRGFDVLPQITGVTNLAANGGGRCYELQVRACYLLPNQLATGQVIQSMGVTNFAENEIAGFGEINYWLTERIKLTAGVRVSRFKTHAYTWSVGGDSSVATAAGFRGTVTHPYPILPGDPETARVTEVRGKDKPINPKFGVTYQISEDRMIYATAAKGYRGGGANANGALRDDCRAQLNAIGYDGFPPTFGSDSVWSYEGGAKIRAFGGRAQLNGSLYYIDWKEPQLNVRLACAVSFVTNAGHAVSKGADFDLRFRVLGGLTASLTGAYTDAQYVEDTVSRDTATGAIAYTVHKGDTLPTPDLQYTLALDYARPLMAEWMGTLHIDYQHANGYHPTVGPGGAGYNANLYNAASTDFATASGTISNGKTELALYVKNLAASKDRLSVIQGAGLPLISYTFRPREYGFTVTRQF